MFTFFKNKLLKRKKVRIAENIDVIPAFKYSRGCGFLKFYGKSRVLIIRNGIMNHDPMLLQEVIRVIDSDIRPSLNMDGGDISVISMEGNVLNVRLQGACAHCPRASMTLQYAVQSTLRKLVSESIEVRSV